MKLLRRLRALFRREKLEAEMAEELRTHLEAQAEANRRVGMEPDEARYAAQRQFGNAGVIRQIAREQRGALWLEHFLRDLAVGARILLKEKAFFALAVFTLALGICGVTAQFSVINSALLRGLPFPDSDRLVRVAMRDPSWAPGRSRNLWTSDLVAWSREQKSFEGLAGYFMAGSFIVTIHDQPMRLSGSHVTDGFFQILGVKPALGRWFTPEDNRPEADRVTILSDSLWKSEFGGDPAVLGRVVRLNGRPATIVGVMPPGFNFPRDQLWLPMFNEFPVVKRPGGTPAVVARLKPGVSAAEAAAELTLLAGRAARDYPETNRAFTEVVVDPLLNAFVPDDARQLLGIMLGAVAAVLVIACGNVMNMQLARATLRGRELAVRSALGASRIRLIVQMLVESLLVAGTGGLLGALGAGWVVRAAPQLLSQLPGSAALPAWLSFEIDGTVLLFTLIATGGTVVLSGLLPAVLASRPDPLEVLKEGGRGQSHGAVNRLAGLLVIGQIGLTGALLIASLLLVKSVRSRTTLDFGYDLRSVLVGRMNFEVDYHDEDTVRQAQAQLLRHLRETPPFTHAAFTTRRGMMTTGSAPLLIEGRPEDRAPVAFEVVSDGYFAALGLHPLEGREFEPGDTPDKPVPVLVNATFARKYFPGESALGHRLRQEAAAPWQIVVGVVPDTRMQGPLDARSDGAGIFLPASIYVQAYASLVVRGQVEPTQLMAALRREVVRITPNLAIYDLGIPQFFLQTALTQTRAVTTLFSLFGLVAVVLSVVGLYGVAAYTVSQRKQELGIRIALGATPRDIAGLVLGQGGRRFAFGALLALVLAFALMHLSGSAVNNLLYKVSPHDPAVYALVLALLAATTLAACLLPAWRATRVDPMNALRSE